MPGRLIRGRELYRRLHQVEERLESLGIELEELGENMDSGRKVEKAINLCYQAAQFVGEAAETAE